MKLDTVKRIHRVVSWIIRATQAWLIVLMLATTVRLVFEIPADATWRDVIWAQLAALAAALLIVTYPRPRGPASEDGSQGT